MLFVRRAMLHIKRHLGIHEETKARAATDMLPDMFGMMSLGLHVYGEVDCAIRLLEPSDLEPITFLPEFDCAAIHRP